MHTHAASETFYVLTGRGAVDLARARPVRVVDRIAACPLVRLCSLINTSNTAPTAPPIESHVSPRSGPRTLRMVQSSCSGSVQWAFGTIRSHHDRPGKMLTLSDSSARSAAYVSTTGSCLAKRTCAGSYADMPPIIMGRGPIDL